MGLLFLIASYAVFYHIGQLLIRLVVVQPLGDTSAVRWCFASTFSLSLSLFNAVLADMAHASLLSSSFLAATPPPLLLTSHTAASTAQVMLRRLQRLVEVNTQEFTFLLLALLLTVVVASPGVALLSFLRHLISRGRRPGGQVGKRSRRDSQQSSSATSSARRRRGSASSAEGSSTGFFFESASGRSRRSWCRCSLRGVLLLCVLMLLVGGGLWASHTGRVDVQAVRQRAVRLGRAVYTQLHTRTTLFQVPQEIQSRQPAEVAEKKAEKEKDEEVSTVVDAVQEQDTEAATPTTAFHRLAEDWTMDSLRSSTSFMELLSIVQAITSRVAVVGVAMIGLLGGYAAVTSPCLFLAPYTYWRGREVELRKAQHNFNKKLCFVLSNYGNAQRQIAALQFGVLHEEWASPAFSGSSPSSTIHKVPPALDFPTSSTDANAYHVSDTLDFAQPQPQPQQPLYNNNTPAAESRYASSRGTPAEVKATPSGAVGWLQRKLTSAASVVTGRYGDSPATPGSSVMSPALSRQRAVGRIKKLREEAKGARFLCLSLYLQLNEVEGMLRDAQRGETWVGRWYAGLGLAMALYSTVKVALTAASLWFFKASTQDPVTRAVSLLEDAFILRRRDRSASPSFSVTAVEVSTHVILGLALLVNGYMVVSSIRGVLLALFHVTTSFSGSAISRPETVAVGLSMLIGVYFVGQLVLLRSSLPSSGHMPAAGASTGDVNVLLRVLGALPYYYYQRLNDWCFLVGCVGAVVVRRFVASNALSSVVYTASGGEER